GLPAKTPRITADRSTRFRFETTLKGSCSTGRRVKTFHRIRVVRASAEGCSGPPSWSISNVPAKKKPRRRRAEGRARDERVEARIHLEACGPARARIHGAD